MSLQPIYDLAALCHRKGLRDVVLCPGSRCAPLTLAFVRHGNFNIRTFTDERSAAFIALGIAQQTHKPCILICTSGTAAYNFAPAVAEAFFSQTPLIVFTADRPVEWIGQQDGQAIHQSEIFGKHVKHSYLLPQHYEHKDDQWLINRLVNEALNLASNHTPAPVHINVPFREPFYPSADNAITFSENIRTIDEFTGTETFDYNTESDFVEEWSSFHRILVVAGQGEHDPELIRSIGSFSKRNNVPIVGDIITNLHENENTIRYADAFLGQASDDVKKSLQPDLLITFGKSVLSKNVKLFLRKYAPQAHWHIQPGGAVADSFYRLTKIIRTQPAPFFELLSSTANVESFEGQKQHNFYKFWEIEERRIARALHEFFPAKEFGEFEVVHELIDSLPDNACLHLANSMSVRYANFIGLTASHRGIKVFSNRGTSGIDGCTSTAVGHALSNDELHILITGDEAFFYDRNAFWHNYDLPNLRIVLLNNHGGVIFKMIDGPKNLPESDDYFVTQQKLNAQKICEEYGFEWLKLDNRRKVKNFIKDFVDTGNTVKIIEIETTVSLSQSVFEDFKNHIKKSYEIVIH